ncbi:PilZ domain-containing protein [Roseibium salinum]|uniref:PilZ domain-containing protein n=1 Tax=Roseibium salinum TaxID=1604349 RepID=A0ABT3R3H4_9HYPH|nr:PilZ domain-containing protein [Roseibium sp. DSM 29163]MCX2723763.1 PilZ domain-containing protein [Roseibium sp. DSM 29163]
MNIPDQAVLQILVLDFDTLACEEVSASGFDKSGCRVQTSNHREVGKIIGLRVAGFEQMIKARIAELLDAEIVVSFDFEESPAVEKRAERRRKVSIPAWVSGRKSQAGVSCKIIDASHSGCRLASPKLQDLPEEIQLQIPGLDLPVVGRIVWRSPEHAGVKLIWQFSNGKEIEQKRYRPPDLAGKVGARNKGKADSSGFGVKRKRPTN